MVQTIILHLSAVSSSVLVLLTVGPEWTSLSGGFLGTWSWPFLFAAASVWQSPSQDVIYSLFSSFLEFGYKQHVNIFLKVSGRTGTNNLYLVLGKNSKWPWKFKLGYKAVSVSHGINSQSHTVDSCWLLLLLIITNNTNLNMPRYM